MINKSTLYLKLIWTSSWLMNLDLDCLPSHIQAIGLHRHFNLHLFMFNNIFISFVNQILSFAFNFSPVPRRSSETKMTTLSLRTLHDFAWKVTTGMTRRPSGHFISSSFSRSKVKPRQSRLPAQVCPAAEPLESPHHRWIWPQTSALEYWRPWTLP